MHITKWSCYILLPPKNILQKELPATHQAMEPKAAETNFLEVIKRNLQQ
jgi:hypothetical protein